MQQVVHFEIAGVDAARLREFYGALVGWTYDVQDAATEVVSRPGEYGFVTGGPTELHGGVCGSDTPRVMFYVGVDDVAAALVKAESLGGVRLMGPAGSAEGGPVVGWIADPEGNVVGVAGPLIDRADRPCDRSTLIDRADRSTLIDRAD